MLLKVVEQRLGGDSLRDLSQSCRRLLLSGDSRKTSLLLLWLGCESFAQKWDSGAVDDHKLTGVGERLADAARKALNSPSLESTNVLTDVLSEILTSEFSPD